jgi:glycosyltransferase involved in cell wall biosynthesis
MITVAIPFYNAEKYLLDSIKSVFAQTFQDWELILIDDGSTDGSLKIAQSIKDSRVRVLSDGKNKRLAARLNEVTQLATYDYIARMDADDLMDPRRLEIEYDILENNPQYDIVTTGVYSVLNDLNIIGKRGLDYEGVTFDEIISRKKGVTHAALLARKSWYERNKYDETLNLTEDLALWIHSSYNNDLKIISTSKPLYIYREEGNVIPEKLLRSYRNERQLIKKYFGVTDKLYIKSLMKSFVVKAMDITSLKINPQKNRNIPLSRQEVEEYHSIIRKIQSTKLPV